jgi:hypothetical protein
MSKTAVRPDAIRRAPGSALDMLVLAAGEGGCVGIDLARDSFVRASWAAEVSDPSVADLVPISALAGPRGRNGATDYDDDEPSLLPPPLVDETPSPPEPLSVVRGFVSERALLFDPARPESVGLVGPPEVRSSLRRGSTRRRLRSLLAPEDQPLLGFAGPSVPYWELRGNRGSLALVELPRGPQLVRREGEHQVRARFLWAGIDQELPLLDPRLAKALWGVRRYPIGGQALAKRVGSVPRFLLVALTGPRKGHCYKVVAAALGRP